MTHRSTTFTDGTRHVEIQMHPWVEEEDALELAHHNYLLGFWSMLAAAAHEGFQYSGRGAIVTRMALSVEALAVQPFSSIPITFGTAELGWFAGLLHADRSGWIQQQMATYDPLTQIVVVLVQDAAPPRAYVIETDMSPAVAYALSQAVLN
ncbi:MAG: hypothetical protein AAGJ10_10845 [Bacteroidota bacterium]